MNKTVLWVLAVVIVAGGWYLYSSTPAQEAGETNEGTGGIVASQAVPAEGADTSVTEMVVSKIPDVVITFTDSGFVPSSVTVKKGQTVRWMNNAGSKVWPASAVHPEHSAYPQKSASDCLGSSFDACKGLAQGESWDFTFNYVGEWKFHNHLNAAQRGAVNVTE